MIVSRKHQTAFCPATLHELEKLSRCVSMGITEQAMTECQDAATGAATMTAAAAPRTWLGPLLSSKNSDQRLQNKLCDLCLLLGHPRCARTTRESTLATNVCSGLTALLDFLDLSLDFLFDVNFQFNPLSTHISGHIPLRSSTRVEHLIVNANEKVQPTMIMLGGRVPKDLRRARALPVYCTFVLLVLFFAKVNSNRSPLEATDVIRRVLAAYQAPLKTEDSIFPRKIWQTWKVSPVQFQIRDLERARSWTTINPGYRYEVLTDDNDLRYVEMHFGQGPGGLNRPDIVNMYRSLNATIIKADLLRYLMMYIEGGVYADIDVEAMRPVDQDWIPSHINEGDVDLVISVEIDEPTYANHTILGQKSKSFCQWTFMCKPRVPVLLRLVDHILGWLEDVARKQNVPIGDIVLNFDEVITGTGPVCSMLPYTPCSTVH
jgi:hypothetical protein